jgi:RNA-directed DNA polymerase
MGKDFTTGMANSGLVPSPPYEELLGSLVEQIDLNVEETTAYKHFVERSLPPLVRTEIFALILGVSHKLLFAIALRPERYYRTFNIQKRSGGKRQIDAPRVFVKTIQRWILGNILYRLHLPPFVTRFVPKRSIITNAQFHLRQRYLIKLDIENFFPSVNTRQVEGVFKTFEYPEKVRRLLAYLCTFRNVLPQGAPTSPCLANLVFLPCDQLLQDCAVENNMTYSRYADDLTFSSNEPISDGIFDKLIQIIGRFGFNINPSKSRKWKPGQRLITTGMMVTEKVQPPREFRRRLRATFHQASLKPNKFRTEGDRLSGLAAFVNMYDINRGADYLKIARNVKREAT